jgi:hypothetical protein
MYSLNEAYLTASTNYLDVVLRSRGQGCRRFRCPQLAVHPRLKGPGRAKEI